MIRVLHFGDPEGARRRIVFLGAAQGDAERLVGGLRAILLSIPLQDGISQDLPALLDQRGIPHARGRDVLLFSVSPGGELGRKGEDGPGLGDILAPVREAVDRYQRRDFVLRCRDRSLDLSGTLRIMWARNVTPDSFSDGGKFLSVDRAVDHGGGGHASRTTWRSPGPWPPCATSGNRSFSARRGRRSSERSRGESPGNGRSGPRRAWPSPFWAGRTCSAFTT